MDHELNIQGVYATYNADTQMITIKYEGLLTCQITLRVYEWMEVITPQIGITNIRGMIIDYRGVMAFDNYFLSTLRVVNKKMDVAKDFSQLPTSLIATSAYQEQMLGTSLRVSQSQDRYCLVKDFESAEQFIMEWDRENSFN